MAECRCGCGRTLGWSAARASGRAVYVASFLPGLKHLQQLMTDEGLEDDARATDEFIRAGRGMFNEILRACHSGSTQFMPHSRTVSSWESTALKICRDDLRPADPGWYETWAGPSNKGPLPEGESTLYA
jgi:hypothetical protein